MDHTLRNTDLSHKVGQRKNLDFKGFDVWVLYLAYQNFNINKMNMDAQ
jgi:hypothetical protein